MATVDEKIRAAVAAALKKNPQATVDELYDLGKSISRSVAKMNKRQFHARYPLQIKRKAKIAARKATGAKPKAKVARKKRAATGGKAAVKKAGVARKKAVTKKAKAAARKTTAAARKARAASGKAAPAKRGAAGRKKLLRRKARAGAAAPAAPAPQLDRDAIRKTFLRFASDLTGAEARKDLVKVLAGVDRYVDEVVKAVAAK